MTQDEIIAMARQADIQDAYSNFPHKGVIAQLEAFAKLVAAKEREECAKLADEYATWGGSNFYDWFKKLAAAIRARGTE
jgi:hypothetical protein